MSNRFDHLKKTAKNSTLSLDEFINAAEKEDKETLSKKISSKKDILLSASGKINREENCGKPFLIYLKKDLINDIEKYCHGSKTLIINYLVRRGLNALVTDKKLTLHME